MFLSLALPETQETDTGKLAVLIMSSPKGFNACSLVFSFLYFSVPQIFIVKVEVNVLHKHQDMCICVCSGVCTLLGSQDLFSLTVFLMFESH